MSEPLSLSERAAHIAELDASLSAPPQHSHRPPTSVQKSGARYPKAAEIARLLNQASPLGLRRLRVSKYYRLALERERSRR